MDVIYPCAQEKKDKLDLRALKCIFIRYSKIQNAHKFFHLASKKIYISIHVIFNEHEFYFSPFHLEGYH